MNFASAAILALIACWMLTPGMAQDLRQSPVPQLLLHFDDAEGKPVDSSGNELPVINKGASAGAPGRFGGAYQFDGSGAHLDAGNYMGLTFCFPEQTIELWVKPSREGQAEGLIGSQDEPTLSSWRWYLAREAEGTVSFHLWDGAQEPHARAITSTTVLAPNQWTHVAVTIAAGKTGSMRLFVNGKQEASGPLRINSPHGRLHIGSCNGGAFAGSMDELAIYDVVIPDEIIASHAAGDGPIPDGAARPEGPEGFRLYPVTLTARIHIRHTSLPGQAWVMMLPEWAYQEAGAERAGHPSEIEWERLPGGALKFHWSAEEEAKRRVGLDYGGSLKPGQDCVEYELTGKNVGDEPWGRQMLSLICFAARGAPDFEDYEAVRTFVRKGDKWISMNEVVGGEFADHRMNGVKIDAGYERLAAKVSKDGKFVTGIITDTAGSLSFNFQRGMSCMHSNPDWPAVKPGESATAKGMVYLLEGGLDDLWERYRRDYPEPGAEAG